MTDHVKDGGPAFACASENGHQSGMSQRDYFAIHCDQPGEIEIVAAAGLRFDSNTGKIIFPDGDDQFFSSWWQALPQDERLRLYSKVRYAIADAMLAERERK